jgi:hypothetical protein
LIKKLGNAFWAFLSVKMPQVKSSRNESFSLLKALSLPENSGFATMRRSLERKYRYSYVFIKPCSTWKLF